MYTLNVRETLLFYFFLCGLEEVQRRCLVSTHRVSAVELWWRFLVPILVLVSCHVWCFLVLNWNKSVRPACPKEELKPWCCVEAAGREKINYSGFTLLPGCQERWVNLWGASGVIADFLDDQHHLSKRSTNLYSKLGCLYQTFIPQPVKCHSSLHLLTFILMTDSGQAAYKFFFCGAWGLQRNFTSPICLIIGCFYL